KVLQERFVREFPEAIVSDFDMLYAIAARRSKVSSSRFSRMFTSLDAPFQPAPRPLRGLFSPSLVDDVFVCREFAFDWTVLRQGLLERLERHGVEVRTGETVERIACGGERGTVSLAGGREVTAAAVFNVTYANLNSLVIRSGLKPLALKHELAEVALIEPPAALKALAVTVMDGPFFSTMPYPAEGLYSLTHVRYTPHVAWTDPASGVSPYDTAASLPHESRWRHMVQDARRYLPCMADASWRRSMFEVKTVLVEKERDDGRPILLHRHPEAPCLYSVMGAKIDNVFDLFEALPQMDGRWRDATADLLLH
ncbi:MAG: hypothetical protein JWO33_1650, partial [Caulobacteraceae bacterium]|nr:hypothetical protein [Caulobacteraceae bacterium]